MRIKFNTALLYFLIFNSWVTVNAGSGWPMWRYEPGRKAFAEINLPANPVLLWTRQMEEPKRAWPFQYEDYFTRGNPDQIGKVSFDVSYEPVVGEGKLFVPSMVSDRVTAYSTDSGEELWRYYAGGPVRFAPVYDSGRVYFVSDDGYLYCLNASSGRLLWNYSGSFSTRMVLGNERIISMWPVRGGPVLKDGIIYFAAGVMPFEGIFIHAVDAASGEKIWTNSTSGAVWDLHQHGGAYAYGGPSPQGYLAVSGDKLIVPGGRTPPAVFDRNSGQLLYFNQASGMVGKGAGGYRVFATDDWFLNHGMLYAAVDGAQFGHVPGDVITDNAFIGVSGSTLLAHKSELETIEVEIEDRLQRGAIARQYEIEELWQEEVGDVDRLYFMTDSYFVISRNGGTTASLITVTDEGKPGETAWEHNVEGEIWSMFAGDGKLFVVTRGGKIYCFGTPVAGMVRHFTCSPEKYEPAEKSAELAGSILRRTGATGGYGMIYGGSDINLIRSLADNSSMHFVVVENDAESAEILRNRMDREGLYGRRVSVINPQQGEYAFLPYIYELIVVHGGDPGTERTEKVFNSLRPYGGKAVFISAGSGFRETFLDLSLENSELAMDGDNAIVTRRGQLAGSGQWTHQYGGASNRTYSDDDLVKPPLGTLWFGGPSNLNALPRHHNGPIPQVAGGRLFILGIETISARCVYTGRELWIKEIPGIGHPFTDLELEEEFWSGNEVYMSNHPGANFIGSPYVSGPDMVYVIHKDKLMALNAATGGTEIEFRLPAIPGIEINEFGHIMVSGDYIITTIDPQIFDDGLPGKDENWNATSSNILLVMNRHTGEMLWSMRAETGFRHNAIAVGNNRVFVVDGLSDGVVEILQRRGVEDVTGSELIALEIDTGRELWAVNNEVFGTWLGYYEDKDILLQGGRSGQRGAPVDEPRERLMAHSGMSGEVLWESNQRYTGPLGLHPDMIISGNPGEPAFNPYTGDFIMREHPITGEEYRWDWHKYYGCGTINSSKYLLTFRSGTAGYADLLNFGGTGNFGGFKGGCTNNIVAADGILNAPDYTRTCTCSYPLQTSSGMVYMPDAGIEIWTLNRLGTESEDIQSLGINFAGQGNRSEDGVLWLEYPKVYDEGPDIPIKIESDNLSWFRNHATWIENGDEKYNWVASYGARGISSVSVDLAPAHSSEEKYYNVTLYFTEPDDISVGERCFDIFLQGDKVLENFDIAKETGGSGRVLRKEFAGVRVNGTLQIEFTGSAMAPVISGIEIVRDEHSAASKGSM